jgi:hypothetical protein
VSQSFRAQQVFVKSPSAKDYQGKISTINIQPKTSYMLCWDLYVKQGGDQAYSNIDFQTTTSVKIPT